MNDSGRLQGFRNEVYIWGPPTNRVSAARQGTRRGAVIYPTGEPPGFVTSDPALLERLKRHVRLVIPGARGKDAEAHGKLQK